MEPTLIETFKQFYFDYRAAAGPDTSFDDALSALTFSVVERAGDFAEAGDLDSIRSLVREFREIRLSAQGSNDSVKERFEREFAAREGRAVETTSR